MFKKIIMAAVAALCLLPFNAMAQEKKSFTLEDLMWGGNNYWNIMPSSPFTAWWGDCLLETKVDKVCTLFDEKGQQQKKQRVLFTVEEVNAAIDTAKVGKVYNLAYATFPYAGKTLAFLTTKNANVLYNWKTKKTEWTAPRESGVQARDYNSGSRSEAYVKDWNLFVTTADGKRHQVTTDGTRELQYGMSVHRDEFGISKGTFWSPKGNLLAFYRMDQTMVTDYPMVDIAHRVAQLAPEKYPMAGMTSHKVTVGVFDPATDKTVFLQAGDPPDR